MRAAALAATWLLLFPGGASQAPPSLPAFDFRSAPEVSQWQAAHDVAPLESAREGMVIRIRGADPYVCGPPRDFPEGAPLWLRIRLKSDTDGTLQLFYYRDAPREDQSVRASMRGGAWTDLQLPIPPLGKGYRIRIDPPGVSGAAVIASISFALRPVPRLEQWPRPEPPPAAPEPLQLRSGRLLLAHAAGEYSSFTLSVLGRRMAIGGSRPFIALMRGNDTETLDIRRHGRTTVARKGEAIVARAIVRDSAGGVWELAQKFAPSRDDAISVESTVRTNAAREVLYVPLLMLHPGVGTFGTRKGQALFPGLEYLDDEPSSSTKDVEGPAASRQVPDTLKITFPMMAIQADGRYLALAWTHAENLSAVFDSPDRLFRSGGHAMGVIYPGSNGRNREESSLLPYGPGRLAAGRTLTLRATIFGGPGASIVPAVQHYVRQNPLPPLPETLSEEEYLAQAAAGWLDSRIAVGDGRYRHAFPGFEPQPAADAAVFLQWLSRNARDPELLTRLEQAADQALEAVPARGALNARVGHVHRPVAPLVFSEALAAAEEAAEQARTLLRRFEPDGSLKYVPGPTDFGRTHHSREASGHTAEAVTRVLEMAAFAGDRDLIREGLRLVRALERFANGVPRGAQTWEIPLHSPDVLASAYLVRAFTLAYELTGEAKLLDQARYWAWTGVPFVYLRNPTGQRVGLYATIPVYAATNWKAPVWMGLPVQWCGLVYADALHRLSRSDAGGPWRRIANGIAASGIAQSWPPKARPDDPDAADPAADRQGLLPDSFDLRAQVRNDAAINPGTLQASAPLLYGRAPLYDFRCFRASGVLAHVPGPITDVKEAPGKVTFTAGGWPGRPYQVLIAGLRARPTVRIDAETVSDDETVRFDPAGRLALTLEGRRKIELLLTPPHAHADRR